MQTSEVLPIYYHLIYICTLLEVLDHRKLCQFCYGAPGMLGYDTVLTGK